MDGAGEREGDVEREGDADGWNDGSKLGEAVGPFPVSVKYWVQLGIESYWAKDK